MRNCFLFHCDDISYHAEIVYGKMLKENNYCFTRNLTHALVPKAFCLFKILSNESFLKSFFFLSNLQFRLDLSVKHKLIRSHPPRKTDQ